MSSQKLSQLWQIIAVIALGTAIRVWQLDTGESLVWAVLLGVLPLIILYELVVNTISYRAAVVAVWLLATAPLAIYQSRAGEVSGLSLLVLVGAIGISYGLTKLPKRFYPAGVVVVLIVGLAGVGSVLYQDLSNQQSEPRIMIDDSQPQELHVYLYEKSEK